MDVQPTVFALSGTVLWDEKTIPDTYGSDYQEWKLVLEDVQTKIRYVAGFHGGTDQYALKIYPGSYDVYFEFAYGEVVPKQINGLVLLAKSLRVEHATTFDIDLKVVNLSGQVSWGGNPIPDTYGSDYPEWRLVLVDTETALRYTTSFHGGQPDYLCHVYPGDYDVFFEFVYGEVVPAQVDGPVRIVGRLSVKADTELDVQPTVVPVSGSIAWGGEPIPDTYGADYSEWKLIFEDTDTGVRYALSFDGGGATYTTNVYPGTYDVSFEFVYADVVLEQVDGPVRVASRLACQAPVGLDINPQVVSLSGGALWGGEMIPDTYGSDYSEWELTFEDVATKVRYRTAFHGGVDSYATKIYPGTYDIYFNFVYGEVVSGQVNGQTKIGSSIQIQASRSFDVNPQVATLSGSVLWGGAMIPDTYGQDYKEWVLSFEEVQTHLRYTASFDGGSGSYSCNLYPGKYDVFFDFAYGEVVVGQVSGEVQIVSAKEIQAQTTLDIHPQTRAIGGKISWDGQTIPDTYGADYDEWRLRFENMDTRLNYYARFDGGGPSYTTKIYPGVYDVYFDFVYGDTVPDQVSGDTRVAQCVEVY